MKYNAYRTRGRWERRESWGETVLGLAMIVGLGGCAVIILDAVACLLGLR